MSDQKEVKGTPWREGAISNACWTGVRLRDILLSYGITPENSAAQHVIFEA
jgi:Oxidoreductase molybdopterin binding domain